MDSIRQVCSKQLSALHLVQALLTMPIQLRQWATCPRLAGWAQRVAQKPENSNVPTTLVTDGTFLTFAFCSFLRAKAQHGKNTVHEDYRTMELNWHHNVGLTAAHCRTCACPPDQHKDNAVHHKAAICLPHLQYLTTIISSSSSTCLLSLHLKVSPWANAAVLSSTLPTCRC